MEIAKAKSSRKRLFPYHEYVNYRDMGRWAYNIYQNDENTVCSLQYGAKMKEKIGFDHKMICEITRAKSKKSIFFEKNFFFLDENFFFF